MRNSTPETSGKGKRHGGLDALRALAALFVIVNHATFLPAGSGEDAMWSSAIIYTLVFPAVPLFVMMSGAFILNRDKNSNAWSFYWHSIKKLFPLSALMFLVYFCLHTGHPSRFFQGTESLASLVKHMIMQYKSGPPGALWFICMLPGLYLLVPLLVIVRQKTTLCVQVLLSGAFMVLYFCQYGLELWGLPHPLSAVSWIGYFLLGMILMNLAEAKRLPSARCTMWVGLCLFAVLAFRAHGYIAAHEDIYPHVEAFMTPSSLIVACTLFIIFAQLKDMRTSWLVSKFAEVSFVVYLTHSLVLHMLRSVLYHLGLISQLHHSYSVSILFTVLGVLLTFLLSWAMDATYKRVCAALGA